MSRILTGKMMPFDSARKTFTYGGAGDVNKLTFLKTLNCNFGTGSKALKLGFFNTKFEQSFTRFSTRCGKLTCKRATDA